MKRTFIFLFAFITYGITAIAKGQKTAWIEERFANSIMEQKKIVGEYLFPIIGFEKVDDKLYILTYGGELQPISLRNKRNRKEIINIESTINTQEWPLDLIKELEESSVLFEENSNKIIVTIITKNKSRKFSFVSSLDGNKFSTLLEMQGWLLNYLILPIDRWDLDQRGRFF